MKIPSLRWKSSTKSAASWAWFIPPTGCGRRGWLYPADRDQPAKQAVCRAGESTCIPGSYAMRVAGLCCREEYCGWRCSRCVARTVACGAGVALPERSGLWYGMQWRAGEVPAEYTITKRRARRERLFPHPFFNYESAELTKENILLLEYRVFSLLP